MRTINHSDNDRFAKALAKVLPHLNGKLHGMALRVPTPNVSLVDLVVDVKRDVSVEAINDAFKTVANGALKGIVEFSEEPLVSIDFNTNTHSAIIDGLSTMVMGDRKVKYLLGMITSGATLVVL